MKAMILAAGLGRRLKEHTKDKPKALVELNGKPAIYYIINNLINAGVSDIVINLHYLSDQIKDFIASQNFSARFYFTEEPELLDTGGALKNARQYLDGDEDFILHNCDIYSDFDLSKIIDNHRTEHDRLVTLATSPKSSDRFLWFSKDLLLNGVENESSGFRCLIDKDKADIKMDYNCINVVSPKIFNYFEDLSEKFTLFEAYLHAVGHGGNIKGFDIGACYWIDIGTPDDLVKANQYLQKQAFS